KIARDQHVARAVLDKEVRLGKDAGDDEAALWVDCQRGRLQLTAGRKLERRGRRPLLGETDDLKVVMPAAVGFVVDQPGHRAVGREVESDEAFGEIDVLLDKKEAAGAEGGVR